MRYALVMHPRTGMLTFLKHVVCIDEGGLDCLYDEREGSFVLEDVIGRYPTINALKADYDRAIRECDSMGDTRGLEWPYPLALPLSFILRVQSSPLHSFPMTKHVYLLADDETRAFMRRRPVFFAEVLRGMNRGQPITPIAMATLAHGIVEAILKKWPDAKADCRVEWA